jgi:hypothetical protein
MPQACDHSLALFVNGLHLDWLQRAGQPPRRTHAGVQFPTGFQMAFHITIAGYCTDHQRLVFAAVAGAKAADQPSLQRLSGKTFRPSAFRHIWETPDLVPNIQHSIAGASKTISRASIRNPHKGRAVPERNTGIVLADSRILGTARRRSGSQRRKRRCRRGPEYPPAEISSNGSKWRGERSHGVIPERRPGLNVAIWRRARIRSGPRAGK